MRRSKAKRRGATVLEMAVITIVFLTLVLGMLDFGIGVFRYHILSLAAREGARRAIVHGEMANVLGSWGPATIDVPASANGVPIVDGANDGLQRRLIGCDLPQSRIKVEWLNGSNAYEEPVRVTVTSPHNSLMAFIFTGGPVTLSASSTMKIAH